MIAGEVVTCELRTRLLGAGGQIVPVPVSLRYDSAEPYAIHATFHSGGAAVVWIFGRELLADGLTGPSGLGDIRLWPSSEVDTGVLYISLHSPDGEALLETSAPEVAAFLDRTFAAVPAGAEPRHLNLDAALTTLIAES